MRYVGIKGVSAYGIMMYIGFIFIAVFIGYSIGVSPIVGYDYGAQNKKELKNIFAKSVVFSLFAGIIMMVLACLFATPLSRIFVRDDRELLALTTRGLRIYSLCFLLAGLNIFMSSFFTALSNGALSLIISFFRTFLCQVIAVLLLPLLLEVDGIWLSAFMAEFITMFLIVPIVLLNKKRYGYL
jgi:Na+-driven multidrug efflux pump